MKNNYIIIILAIIISNYYCKYFYRISKLNNYIFLYVLGATLFTVFGINLILMLLNNETSKIKYTSNLMIELLFETLGFILPIIIVVYFVNRYKNKKGKLGK
jgi:hypothetical protein